MTDWTYKSREMRLVKCIPLFYISLVNSWSLTPSAIKVDENERTDDVGVILDVASEMPGVKSYKLTGTEENTGPFYLKQGTTCGASTSCSLLYLKESFEIDGEKTHTLDREKKEQYTLTIKAVDGENIEKEEATFTITVRDKNDNQPVFTQASLNIHCAENLKNGDVCGTVQAIDDDVGLSGEVEYSIPTAMETWYPVNGPIEHRNLGIFGIDRKSGVITLKNPDGHNWDRELYEKVVIQVRARDAPGAIARTDPVDQSITIMINDENDSKAVANDYPREILVGELAPHGTRLFGENQNDRSYTFQGTDADMTTENNRVTFKIVSPSNSPFTVSKIGNTNEAFLVVEGPLDYETVPVYYLQLLAYNKGAQNVENTESTLNVKISVQDQNEAPIWQDTDVIFWEHAKNGDGPLNGIHPHAKDPDFGSRAELKYSILKDPENYFSINPKTGLLTYTNSQPLDRECNNCNWKEGYYNLTLSVCDNESPSLCSNHHQRIKIKDIDDSGPELNIDSTVCKKTSNSVVLSNMEVIDKDDCNANHCGKPKMFIVGHNKKLFDLVKLSDFKYDLVLKEGEALEEIIYKILVLGSSMGPNGENVNEVQSTINLDVCSCADTGVPSDGCNKAIVAGGFEASSIMAIIAALLFLIMFVVLLIVYKHKQNRGNSKEGLLDDLDDERATVMVYSTEGGGEEDQTNYNTATLIRAKNEEPLKHLKRAIKPSVGGFGHGMAPEDIGQYINAAKDHADQDVHAAPYDSLLTFDYEGNNSIIDDLSSTSTDLDNLDDFDADHNIITWGSKFRKLADLYAGKDNESYHHI